MIGHSLLLKKARVGDILAYTGQKCLPASLRSKNSITRQRSFEGVSRERNEYRRAGKYSDRSPIVT
jgi:hypothetical protein